MPFPLILPLGINDAPQLVVSDVRKILDVTFACPVQVLSNVFRGCPLVPRNIKHVARNMERPSKSIEVIPLRITLRANEERTASLFAWGGATPNARHLYITPEASSTTGTPP